MNNRGMIKIFIILILIVVIVLLYFQTEATKELVGMAFSSFDPLQIDEENKTVTVNFANASEVAHQVILEAADDAEEFIDEETEEIETDEEPENGRNIPNYADAILDNEED